MYQLTQDPATILRLSDGAFIPADAGNADYLEFIAWRGAGNEPAPYVPPEPPIPIEVTKRQATQALILAGFDEQVEAMLAEIPGIEGKLARAEWNECQTVRRDRPLVLQMQQKLGWTDEQLDHLFVTADGIQ